MAPYSETLFYKTITDLSKMSEENFQKLLAIANRKELSKNEILLEEHKICKSIFFVEVGYLRSFIYKDGGEINTNFTFEGNFATNLKSLRTSSPSDIIIKAEERCVIFEFDKDKLFELYKESSEIESFGRSLLEHLLMKQEEHSNLFKIYSPLERYNYLQTNAPMLLQRVSLTQLASYIGVARETLSRLRKK